MRGLEIRTRIRNLAKKLDARGEASHNRYIAALKNDVVTHWEKSVLSNHQMYDVVRDTNGTILEVTRDPNSSVWLPKWLIQKEGKLVEYTDEIRDELGRKTGFDIHDVQTLTITDYGQPQEFHVLTGYAATADAKKLVGV